MKLNDVIRLAREAGMHYSGACTLTGMESHVERFANLVERHKREELARKIEQMPFGDTSASFAAWIREQE